MKYFNVVFKDKGAVGRYSDDKNSLVAELAEEFPGREISSIIESYMPVNEYFDKTNDITLEK